MKKFNMKTWEKQFLIQILVSIFGGDVNALLREIKEDKSRDTIFWYACHQVGYLILSKDSNWFELAMKIDYLKKIVQDEIIKNLPKWFQKEMSVTEHLDSFEHLVSWLFERYTNMLRNATDDRYKMYVRLDLVEFEDEKSYEDDMTTEDKIILDSFRNYSVDAKKAILKIVYENSWDDFSFDQDDLNYLCEKFGAPNAETFIDFSNPKVAMIQSKVDGFIQLSFDFEVQK